MELSFLGRSVPPQFRLRIVAVEPGCEQAYVEAEWLDTLVVVEQGEVDLEWVSGSRCRFVRGDVLFLAGLPLRALRNPGDEPMLLAAVSRDEFPAEPASKK
jgi:hypothetical protein